MERETWEADDEEGRRSLPNADKGGQWRGTSVFEVPPLPGEFEALSIRATVDDSKGTNVCRLHDLVEELKVFVDGKEVLRTHRPFEVLKIVERIEGRKSNLDREATTGRAEDQVRRASSPLSSLERVLGWGSLRPRSGHATTYHVKWKGRRGDAFSLAKMTFGRVDEANPKAQTKDSFSWEESVNPFRAQPGSVHEKSFEVVGGQRNVVFPCGYPSVHEVEELHLVLPGSSVRHELKEGEEPDFLAVLDEWFGNPGGTKGLGAGELRKFGGYPVSSPESGKLKVVWTLKEEWTPREKEGKTFVPSVMRISQG